MTQDTTQAIIETLKFYKDNHEGGYVVEILERRLEALRVEALDKVLIAARSAADDLDLCGSNAGARAMKAWETLRNALAEYDRVTWNKDRGTTDKRETGT